MELFPLDLPDLPGPDPAAAAAARMIRRGPRTIQEVLQAALADMELDDQAEAYQADPVAYVRARRPRRLIDVLLGRQ